MKGEDFFLEQLIPKISHFSLREISLQKGNGISMVDEFPSEESNLKWSLLHKMSTNRTGQSVQVHDNDCRLLLVIVLPSWLDSLSPHSFRTRSVFHMTAKICHRLLK